jgi:hypothetical protein
LLNALETSAHAPDTAKLAGPACPAELTPSRGVELEEKGDTALKVASSTLLLGARNEKQRGAEHLLQVFFLRSSEKGTEDQGFGRERYSAPVGAHGSTDFDIFGSFRLAT